MMRMMWTLVMVVGMVGCAGGGPTPPAGWVGRPATPADVDDGPPARMQMLICYGQVSSHILIRLVDPASGLVLWDPGGLYGEPNPRATGAYRDGVPDADRRRDVIFGRVPTLDEYWHYRRHLEARNGAMAVYEWPVTDAQMARLRAPLIDGRGLGGEAFDTDIGGLWCGTATGDYLIRYADDIVPSAGNDLNPSTMAARLWRRDRPARVIVYRGNQPTQVYEQPR